MLFSYGAKFIAATVASCQALWLKNLLSEMIESELKPLILYVNNKSTVMLMNNSIFHSTTNTSTLTSTLFMIVLRSNRLLWSLFDTIREDLLVIIQ